LTLIVVLTTLSHYRASVWFRAKNFKSPRKRAPKWRLFQQKGV